MSESETWTIGRLLEWTKDYLSNHGSQSPRLDAEVLLAHAKRCQRIELYTSFDEVANDELREVFRKLIKARADGTPVAYLVGRREFYSLPFIVSPAVLIPRPETESLVLRLLDLAKEFNARASAGLAPAGKKDLTIVDVGTGSGIIAICAAIYLPTARIIATDISAEALDIARRNALNHQVEDRIEFRQGNLLDDIADPIQFIVSNPPYVSESEFAELDPQVKDFEPKEALLAGPSGTETIEKLIAAAACKLAPDGWLLLEISPMIAPAVEQLVSESSNLSRLKITNDMAKLPRIVEVQRAG